MVRIVVGERGGEEEEDKKGWKEGRIGKDGAKNAGVQVEHRVESAGLLLLLLLQLLLLEPIGMEMLVAPKSAPMPRAKF
jgi:hypothetical protein